MQFKWRVTFQNLELLNKKVVGRLLGSSVYLGASPSGLSSHVRIRKLETSVRLHTFQFSIFVRETPIFVVGFSCCCANTKSPAAKLCFERKYSRLRNNLLKILQNCFATKMASLRNLYGRKSLWFLTPEQLNKFMSNSAPSWGISTSLLNELPRKKYFYKLFHKFPHLKVKTFLAYN